MKSLDPRVIQLWRLQGVVRVLAFQAPLMIGGAIFLGFKFGVALAAALAVAVVVLLLALALAWPSLSWARFRYGVRDHDLLVEQGVVLRHAVSIPLDRIQHVDTQQGPLERLFGLSRVTVYTAAGMSADGSIPGLDEADANHLRDRLARRGDDGV